MPQCVLSRTTPASSPMPFFGSVLDVFCWADMQKRVLDSPETIVIGGAETFSLFMPHAHRIFLNTLDEEFDGDLRMPEWELIYREWSDGSGPNARPHEFAYWLRRWRYRRRCPACNGMGEDDGP